LVLLSDDAFASADKLESIVIREDVPASSDTDPDKPYRRGFSFGELTKMIQKRI
jgi:hypothetical protein